LRWRIVSIATPIEPPAGAGAKHIVARNDVADLEVPVELVDTGTIDIDISSTGRLAGLPDVHRLGQAGRTFRRCRPVPH
ncbi:hypothetical protein ACFV9E_42910, partial [Streptomyces sp. NPDC059835]